MKLLIIILTTFFFIKTAGSQDSLPLKNKYKALLVTLQDHKTSGDLFAIDDSSISISKPTPKNAATEAIYHRAYNFSEIDFVAIKHKNVISRGALLGGIMGMSSGILLALIEGGDPHIPPEQDFFGIGEAFRLSAGQKAILYGTSLGAGGALAGMLIGMVATKKFTINGNKEKFDQMKLSVIDRTYSR